MATIAPYGTWVSPITAELVVAGARTVSELRVDGGDVCWLESRPDEGGRSVVMRRRADGAVEDITPPGANVRTRVHEYGGGAYLVDDGVVWFVEFADQRVYRLEPGAPRPRPITPEPAERGALRYADFALTADGRHLVCVRETHHGPDAQEVVNEIVALPADGDGETAVLAAGSDFYAAPRLSPDGRRLAYVRWDHPNMPWDETELVVARLDGLEITGEHVVAGGLGSQESAILPEWAPDGVLHLISDRAGWWNLHRWDGGQMINLARVEVCLGQPPWQLGASLLGFLDDGRIAVVATEQAVERPSLLDPGASSVAPLAALHTACRSLVAAGDSVWFAGAAPDRPLEIVRVTPSSGRLEVAYRTRDLPVEPAWLPVPESIAFPTGDGETAHAHVYPPRSPEFRGPDGQRPPLIVTSHGGPTAHVAPQLSLGIAFWTSRGFAVADVNYRGSTGYGRQYRHALRGRWGIADVEDCVAAARFLVDRGAADPERLLIRGGSASGYTTLCALAFHDVFAAGASHFGVSDLALLAEETHKFESRYLDRLIGPYPEAADVYRARSPVHHADQLSRPVIFFQGLEDEVVPPSQAEAMVAALARGGVPHAYVTFADEQHGFRKAPNLIRALEAELSFYTQVLGLAHPDGVEPVDVRGL